MLQIFSLSDFSDFALHEHHRESRPGMLGLGRAESWEADEAGGEGQAPWI